MKSELEVFDGADNRKEIMILLHRLGSDRKRAQFLEALIPHSHKGFAGCPMTVNGNCDFVAAYFMLVGICNELGVSINEAASKLEKQVKEDERVTDNSTYHVPKNGRRGIRTRHTK